MALFTARRSTRNGETTEQPEPGRGVRATWRYTVGTIAAYGLFVTAVSTLVMLGGGEYGMQLPDLVILVLALTSAASLVRYCWFFRRGLGGGLPARHYTLWLLLPGGALWFIGLGQPHTLWVGAVPLWLACNALAVVVGRRPRWWILGVGLVVLLVHGPLGLLLGHTVGGPSWEGGAVASLAVWALMTPMLFVASIWWWDIVLRLDDSRRTSGELAVAKERLRFAADLHDIQGHHLQVIALKTELAGRLLDADPEAARVQITEAQQLARTALEDTRALVHGYRTVSLSAEAANAAEVLRAAGIECSVDVDADALPAEERTLFGLVIREATTNILRHSEAIAVTLCLARTGTGSVLTVINDGVGADARPGGSGIDGLRRRFEAVGGGIEVRQEDGLFVLTATTPGLPGTALGASGASRATPGPVSVPAAPTETAVVSSAASALTGTTGARGDRT
ncbi:sensor histidine kinase [Arthrobacter sp. SX1312]|uniref:sensor histidine kinase n=1 Tax=Arthrobacter sp. SX1312 TaxID=2058896 RepID=UPI0015E1BE64|nr:histidine kinase [Arthrobacter sp. SX1312]